MQTDDLDGDIGYQAITERVLPVLEAMNPSPAVREWLETGHRTATGVTLLLHLLSKLSGVEQKLVDMDNLFIESGSDFWSCKQVLDLPDFAEQRSTAAELSPYWERVMYRWDDLIAIAARDDDNNERALMGSLLYLSSIDPDWQSSTRDFLDSVKERYPQYREEGWLVYAVAAVLTTLGLGGIEIDVEFPDGFLGVTLCKFGHPCTLALMPKGTVSSG